MSGAQSPGPLSLRGHHFLCALHYRGAGYSEAFTANFTRLVEAVAQGQRQQVVVAEEADGICTACPSLQADGRSCEFQASVMNRDQALLSRMGWQPGQVLDLEAAQWAVLARRGELMEATCEGCEWRPRCDSKGPYGVASPLAREGALDATGSGT